jgi:hypothetical protein
MNFVKPRCSCTAKIHISDEKFDELKSDFLNKIDKAVSKFDIPPEVIYNWDHTGTNYVPVSNWTMEVEGSKKVPIVGLDDKRQITVVFAGFFWVIFNTLFLISVFLINPVLINLAKDTERGQTTKTQHRKLRKDEQNGPHRKTGDEPKIIIQINKITHVNIVKQKITRNREH